MKQSMQISLPSNPSTGYCWTAYIPVSDQEFIEVSSTYRHGQPLDTPPEEIRVGGGGFEDITIQWDTDLLILGAVTLLLQYRQPWDGGGIGDIFRITIPVNKKTSGAWARVANFPGKHNYTGPLKMTNTQVPQEIAT